MTVTAYSVPASAIIEQFRACGFTHLVTVPDYVQISVHMAIEAGELESIKNISCSTEDEAVAIALGLWIGGQRPMVMMQNQGVYASANALRSAGVSAACPMLLMVGQWGREVENLGKDPRESKRREVRRTEPVLDALEIGWFRMEGPDDVEVISAAWKKAESNNQPVAVLVGAHTSWD